MIGSTCCRSCRNHVSSPHKEALTSRTSLTNRVQPLHLRILPELQSSLLDQTALCGLPGCLAMLPSLAEAELHILGGIVVLVVDRSEYALRANLCQFRQNLCTRGMAARKVCRRRNLVYLMLHRKLCVALPLMCERLDVCVLDVDVGIRNPF